ncbi:pseudouridine synthase [Cupriavidus metallidurans]|uniref:Dual-specificity RNA pseudouridine synthase RluF n=2 Tax=Cupriavidus metallidurans TaxID=119219 RepID=Q1LNG1_CUPMC|nr:pseudouridine synthase [Cupriavidus metallidurans]ABF08315.1 16S rRNA uridine-516 pseudouridylate synthase [Cupriavidus metallidurans CH34]QGS30707.1 pseudouridine synthase [Cupriavidus metallidurans]
MTDSNTPGRKTLGIKTTSSSTTRKASRPVRVSDLNRKRVQEVVTGIKQAKDRASDKDKRKAGPADGAPRNERQDRPARPARPRPAEGERAPRRFAEGERAPRRFSDEERPQRERRYGDDNRPAQPRRYGDDNRAERPRRFSDEDRAARPRRFGDEERPQRERRYGDDNRPAQPRRYGDDNRAERPRRFSDENRAASPRRFGDEERPQRERRYGDDNRPAQPRRYGDDNRAERPRRFSDENRAAPPRRFGDEERPQRERRAGDDNRSAQPRRYGDDNRAERPRRYGDDERTQRTERPHRSDEARAPRRQHQDDNAPRRGDAPARRFSDSADRARGERTERPVPRAEARQPVSEHEDGLVRLSKRMSELGLCSRREADEWIPRGWVLVDGKPVTELGTRIRPEAEIEILQAARSEQGERVTVLLNKPVGYVSGQAEDGYEPAAVLFAPENQWELDPTRKRFAPWQRKNLAPAGRLDIDSTGLLVLTQDGRVARALIGDDSNVEKEYLVRVEWESPQGLVERNISAVFPDDLLERLRHGLSLDGVALKPAKVSWQNEEQLRFVLREGRKRQIRRMCEQVGLKVVGLKRVRMGRVVLGDLPPGQWRFLGAFEKF